MTDISLLTTKVAELAARCTVKLAGDPSELLAIQRLRYVCYRRENMIAEDRCELFADEFDSGRSNTKNLLVLLDGNTVAAIRLHVLIHADDDSPSLRAFGDILRPMLSAGLSMLDCTRMVVDRETTILEPKMIYFLLRLPFASAAGFNIDRALAPVRTAHAPFYNRMFSFDRISEPRAYPGLTQPLTLMMADYRRQRRTVFQKLPFLDLSSLDEVLCPPGRPIAGADDAAAEKDPQSS